MICRKQGVILIARRGAIMAPQYEFPAFSKTIPVGAGILERSSVCTSRTCVAHEILTRSDLMIARRGDDRNCGNHD